MLTVLSELKDYRKQLYDQTLERIASLQNEEDGGWPFSIGGRSELTPTIWVVNALVKSNQKRFAGRVSKGLKYILSDFQKGFHVKDSNAADWSMLLMLADHQRIVLTHESSDEIQELANAIKKRAFKDGDVRFIRKKLPRKFSRIRESILELLETSHPEIFQKSRLERFLKTVPPWLKWVIGVVVIGIVLGVISNILYNFLFGR